MDTSYYIGVKYTWLMSYAKQITVKVPLSLYLIGHPYLVSFLKLILTFTRYLEITSRKYIRYLVDPYLTNWTSLSSPGQDNQ